MDGNAVQPKTESTWPNSSTDGVMGPDWSEPATGPMSDGVDLRAIEVGGLGVETVTDVEQGLGSRSSILRRPGQESLPLAAQGLSFLIQCLGHSLREIYGVVALLLFFCRGREQREQIPPDLRLQVLCILAQAEPPQRLAQRVGVSGRRQGGSHFAPAEDDLDRSQAGELHRFAGQLDGGVAKDDRIAQQLVEVKHHPPVSTHLRH